MTARISGAVFRSVQSMLGTAVGMTLFAAVVVLLSAPAPPAHAQGESAKRVLMYTGTTGYRHGNGQTIDNAAVNTMIDKLEEAGFEVDYRTCDGNGAGGGNGDPSLVTNTNLVGCRNPTLGNPATFTSDNLAQYDVLYFHSASDYFAPRGGSPGQLFNAAEEQAIIEFVQNGGGIAAIHNSTDMSTGGAVSWDWWDGGPNSLAGTTMAGHSAGSPTGNAATVQVADRNHLSTRDLPDTYEIADEHYNYNRNVRGSHHVLATFDERTYNTGGNSMGQDHPISWCKLYDGDSVEDGTVEPKNYNDGRAWLTGMGHYAVRFTENGGDNELVTQIVGGIRWVSGEGLKSDCTGTVWSSFTRTTLVNNANDGPIALDVSADGKVFWTEIGSQGPWPNYTSQGYVKMHDPEGPPNNSTTVAAIPTRADQGPHSEDGVLGMSLEPGFDLSDPEKRDIYVYYSPRDPAWPTSGNDWTLGYNQVSRFTMNAAGTAFEPESERVIMRVNMLKISGSPVINGVATGSNGGHVGGASLVFDADGNLVIGTGDDIPPNAQGHGGMPPLDYRAIERRDARKTSANTNDLRGKILRIKPVDDVEPDTEPGLGQTYTVPADNMFEPGTPNTRPEILAMGFRQPYTVHADPDNPGTVVVGEYCHDSSSNVDQRGPAGTCEWNLIDEPGFHGWPLCVGDNSPLNTSWRWNYNTNSPTGEQYDCSLSEIPSDHDWAPPGASNGGVSNPGRATIPGPATPATIWKKYPGAAGGQSAADFGDLSAGGMQPITGPIYRWRDSHGPSAFPRYYDGSWLITNRGSNGGFWKEARLRSDNNEMLRVHDFMPDNQFGPPQHGMVIGTRFGPDGALYLARYPVGCCRNNTNPGQNVEILKIESAVVDECLEDEFAPNIAHSIDGQPHPSQASTWVVNHIAASMTITASDVGCAGLDKIEYRVDGGPWQEYSSPIEFDSPGSHEVDYRASDRFDPPNVSDIHTVNFETVEVDDTNAPEVEASISGPQDAEGNYRRVTMTIDASDELSPIDSIEYSTDDGANWTTETFSDPTYDDGYSESLEVEFTEEGDYEVLYRATDAAENTSEEGVEEFTIVAGECLVRSDEFEGSELDPKWNVRVEDGDYSIEDGQLVLPILDEIDGTRTGPLALVSQQVPDSDWSLTTRVTPDLNSSWAQAGIMLWQSDGNFVKYVFGRNTQGTQHRVELASDDPIDQRETAGGAVTVDMGITTMWLRLIREGTVLRGEYAPDDGGAPGDWVEHPKQLAVSGVQPANGRTIDPPREGDGVQLGLYAGSDYTGAPYEQQARFDFARFDPDDECPEPDDTTPPVTTSMLVAPMPGPGGTYDGMVRVVLSAADPGENASGVKETSYRVTKDGVVGDWQLYDPITEIELTEDGSYVVEYFSEDNAGNVEDPPGQVSFSIERADETGEADLRISAQPRVHRVGPNRKQVRYAFRARNVGDAPSGTVNLCARGPARRVNIRGKRCVTRQVPPGAQRQRAVVVRIKPAARGKTTRINLIARGPQVENHKIAVRLRVRR